MRAPRISSAAVALLALALATTALAAPPELRFSEDGTFKIIQLTDLHFGSAGLRDRRTTRVGPWDGSSSWRSASAALR